MITSISTIEIKKNLGEILNRILYNGEEILIESKGKPVAKLVPLSSNKPNLRENWERYHGEINQALLTIAKLPKSKRPPLLK